MGREVQRVDLNFDWPIGMLWKGYINPYQSQSCDACGGTGLNPETRKLSDDWYSFDKAKWVYVSNDRRYNDLAWANHLEAADVAVLVAENRLRDFTHTYKQGEGWVPKDPPYTPTPEEINEWNRTGFGHDSINQWICVRARAERLGVYGKCKYCEGDGHIWATDQVKELHEKWKSFDPPAGEGYQLWSTTTEGHPMSPVFKTMEELCQYLAAEKVSSFGSSTASKEEWLEWLQPAVRTVR